MYGTNYGTYGSSPYSAYSTPYTSSYGGYGNSYGGYGMGASRFGYGGPIQPEESDFVRIAEERSRSALQSVETIVQAFGSISLMLESTLNAFYSSFRAVLGVADQFTRLRAQLASIVSTLAAVRLLSWMFRRLMVFLRLRPASYLNVETAWTHAQLPGTLEMGKPKPTNYFALVFFGIAIAGPWLIWKLIRRIVATVEESRKWAHGEAEHYEAKVLFDFVATQPTELSLKVGEIIRVAPKEEQPSVRGWLLAADITGTRIGLVPHNYIQVTGRRNVEQQVDMERAFASQLRHI